MGTCSNPWMAPKGIHLKKKRPISRSYIYYVTFSEKKRAISK
jgi:hypothetical protein